MSESKERLGSRHKVCIILLAGFYYCARDGAEMGIMTANGLQYNCHTAGPNFFI
jgi:hypothetical protein